MANPEGAFDDLEFDVFVRDHATSLLRTSWLLTGERDAAEDLLQDTLTRLYPKWSRVSGSQTPLAYVRRCLLNEYLGGRRRRSATFVEFLDRDDARSVPDIGDGVASRDATVRLLRLLPERQRSAVVLRYFHDLGDADIADQLHCRRATVRSLISRALTAMRATEDELSVPTANERTLR